MTLVAVDLILAGSAVVTGVWRAVVNICAKEAKPGYKKFLPQSRLFNGFRMSAGLTDGAGGAAPAQRTLAFVALTGF